MLDVRVEKAFKVMPGKTLSVFMDGYNLTNTNAATNINWSSGATYLTPSTIIPPRLARFGAKFRLVAHTSAAETPRHGEKRLLHVSVSLWHNLRAHSSALCP